MFGPVHVTGRDHLHTPVLRHAGHIAPLNGLPPRSQSAVGDAHRPAAAPVNLLSLNDLRMCARKEGEQRRESAVSERSAARRWREQSCGAAQREEERDAQLKKLREQAESVWNGAADLVFVQEPAIVCARKENEGGRAR